MLASRDLVARYLKRKVPGRGFGPSGRLADDSSLLGTVGFAAETLQAEQVGPSPRQY